MHVSLIMASQLVDIHRPKSVWEALCALEIEGSRKPPGSGEPSVAEETGLLLSSKYPLLAESVIV